MKRIVLVAIAAVTVLMLALVACSAPAATFLFKFGTQGSGDGQFNNPTGIAVDASGNIYVADFGNFRIQKFTSDGIFVAKWGTQGSGDGQFNTADGQYQGEFFPNVLDIAVDASGNVYVADMANHRIQKFTSGGAFLAKWGTLGDGDGQFQNPKGIAVDASGNVYVADYGNKDANGFHNDRIQKFTSGGAFLAKWGNQSGGDGQFSYPYSVAVDASGNVYVADSGSFRIQKFTSDGTFVAKWGSEGSTNGQFQGNPTDVAVDASGNVYVVDRGGNKPIKKFTSGGAFLAKWGGYDGSDGQFRSGFPPTDVAVGPSGNVYVADSGNNRIQVFTSGEAR